jgi:hypothetical protein
MIDERILDTYFAHGGARASDVRTAKFASKPLSPWLVVNHPQTALPACRR